jgi:beta-galactosidase
MPNGCVEGCLPTINGATGDDIFSRINHCHPGGPYFVSEFYPAWFDNWGQRHSRRGARESAGTLDRMLGRGVSVSIYMFHGGTNFAYTNGANQHSEDQPYTPQPTSYDYDAPLGESANITEKYRAFRDVIGKYLPAGTVLPEIPAENPVAVVPKFETTASVALLDLVKAGGPLAARAVPSRTPLTMEDLGQDYGYVLYRAKVPTGFTGRLKVDAVRDYVVVMVNGRMAGTLDRRLRQSELPISIPPGGTLDLLVENVGRLNYGRLIFDNHKGITKAVLLDGKPLEGWTQYPLPLHRENVSALPFGAAVRGVPAFHRGSFRLDKAGDLFLDLGTWGKGAVWVNGRSIGKFWRIGPQQTLYVPGPWLRAGENEVIVLELLDQGSRTLAGLEKAVLDEIRPDAASFARPGKSPVLDEGDLAWSGELAAKGAAPQEIRFKPVTARHVCLEFGPSRDDEPFVCVPELEFLDGNGKPLPRAAYSVWWADSEERGEAFSCAAENAIDGNPKTYWHTAWKGTAAKPPHRLVIDLGAVGTVGGVRFTGRAQPQGYPKTVKIYARPQFFL